MSQQTIWLDSARAGDSTQSISKLIGGPRDDLMQLGLYVPTKYIIWLSVSQWNWSTACWHYRVSVGRIEAQILYVLDFAWSLLAQAACTLLDFAWSLLVPPQWMRRYKQNQAVIKQVPAWFCLIIACTSWLNIACFFQSCSSKIKQCICTSNMCLNMLSWFCLFRVCKRFRSAWFCLILLDFAWFLDFL